MAEEKKNDRTPGTSAFGILAVRLPESLHDTVPFFQGPATNKLATISTLSKKPEPDPITDTAIVEKGDFKVLLQNFSNLSSFSISTHKLLDALVIAFTRSHPDNCSRLSLREYVEMLGKSPTKHNIDQVRRTVRDDLNILYNLSIEFEETNAAGKSQGFKKLRLCSSVGISRGTIEINFSNEFASYLRASYLLQYPVDLLRLDGRNPNTYYLARKLALSWNINRTRANRRSYDIISVQALMNCCPDLPWSESVSDRHYSRKIIEPFESALSVIQAHNLFSWEYCNKNGEPLSQDQLINLNYAEILQMFIKYKKLYDSNSLSQNP